MVYKSLTLIACSLLILVSCKREKTTWDSDWAAPIAYGRLTINDMIPVEYTETNDAGYLSLVINESVYEFAVDTLVQLPDTNVVQKIAINVPSIEVTPSFIIPNSFEQVYNVGDIELKRVILGSGQTVVGLASVWSGKTTLTMSLPGVSGPDGIFSNSYDLEAGSFDAPAEVTDVIDMKDYDMDLTGTDDNSFNMVEMGILVQSNEETENYIVTSADSNTIAFAFQDLVPVYAKGYFGQHYFSDTTGVAIPQLKQIVAGSINIDSIDLKLTIKNGFNMVAQSKITSFYGTNQRTGAVVDLDFPQKNISLNIDPADGGLYDYTPSEYDITLNNTNSNITDFIENLSDSILFGYELEINPFGNITSGSDEFFPGSTMELVLEGEFPLDFAATDLTIVDTLTLEWFDAGTVTPLEGALSLVYENAFPMGAEPIFYLLDDAGTVLDSITGNSAVQPGMYDADSYATSAATGSVVYDFSSTTLTNLENTDRIVLKVAFNTDGTENVKISPDTYFDFKLRSNIQIRIAL